MNVFYPTNIWFNRCAMLCCVICAMSLIQYLRYKVQVQLQVHGWDEGGESFENKNINVACPYIDTQNTIRTIYTTLICLRNIISFMDLNRIRIYNNMTFVMQKFNAIVLSLSSFLDRPPSICVCIHINIHRRKILVSVFPRASNNRLAYRYPIHTFVLRSHFPSFCITHTCGDLIPLAFPAIASHSVLFFYFDV